MNDPKPDAWVILDRDGLIVPYAGGTLWLSVHAQCIDLNGIGRNGPYTIAPYWFDSPSEENKNR